MRAWDPEKEEKCRDGVQAAPAVRLDGRGASKQALPAITAGKIIKEKVFPVSVPPGNVFLRPPLWVYHGLDAG